MSIPFSSHLEILVAVLAALPVQSPSADKLFLCGAHSSFASVLWWHSEQSHSAGPGSPLTLVCVTLNRHTLALFSKERLGTDHIVQILSYCKAFFKGGKKKKY